jgi:periplasmic protein TonB
MMHVLMESGTRRRPRSAPATATSVAVHAGIITLAVALTQSPPTDATPQERPRPELIFIAPSTRAPRTTSTPSVGAPSPLALPVRPEIRIPTLSLPTVPTFDANAPASRSLASELRLGPGLRTDLSSGPAMPGGAYNPGSVDRIAVALSANPRPAYPQSLRGAGLEGEVLITFVVDTTGRVETGSLKVVQSTHPLFTDAVRKWLPATRYRPAEVGGRKVRQYVQQQVGFALANER